MLLVWPHVGRVILFICVCNSGVLYCGRTMVAHSGQPSPNSQHNNSPDADKCTEFGKLFCCHNTTTRKCCVVNSVKVGRCVPPYQTPRHTELVLALGLHRWLHNFLFQGRSRLPTERETSDGMLRILCWLLLIYLLVLNLGRPSRRALAIGHKRVGVYYGRSTHILVQSAA